MVSIGQTGEGFERDTLHIPAVADLAKSLGCPTAVCVWGVT